jgi:hypothetical protein
MAELSPITQTVPAPIEILSSADNATMLHNEFDNNHCRVISKKLFANPYAQALETMRE